MRRASATCSKDTATDVAACCIPTGKAKCRDVPGLKTFSCGADKVYDVAKKDRPCAAAACNSATAAELVALSAVGPKTAALIVAHRREHGAFARLEQLLAIKGIGRKTLDKLRPLVTLD